MRVLVTDVVHHPRDARVSERQIAALLAAGHEVTQAMPFTAYACEPLAGVRAIDLPVARGRKRVRAMRAARAMLKEEAPRHDVVLLHSPELLVAAAGLDHPAIVWDVHEDTAAALTMKPWLPGPLRPAASRGVAWAEAWAERHHLLLLAETAYRDRFRGDHPVVPNTPRVPDAVATSQAGRVVYVGNITRARGGDALIELGRRLAPAIEVEVIGGASADMEPRLRAAADQGFLVWRGFIGNDEALARVEGATAGLSLLRDEPNYRHSMPTKILEYLARGVPAVTTPLPLAKAVVDESGAGIVVPFDNPDAVESAVRRLNGDDLLRQSMANAGRAWIAGHADWNRDGEEFVAVLQEWAARPR